MQRRSEGVALFIRSSTPFKPYVLKLYAAYSTKIHSRWAYLGSPLPDLSQRFTRRKQRYVGRARPVDAWTA